MQTIFSYHPTPFEVMLITGLSMTRENYVHSDRTDKDKTIDLFRLFLIRRDKAQARVFLQHLDRETRRQLQERELSLL